MQTKVRVCVLSSLILAFGCTGFEARNYDAPAPPRSTGGVAGYSYQAGRGNAGSAAVLPAPRDQEGDWGPSGAGSATTLGDGGTRGGDADGPVTHHERSTGGSGGGGGVESKGGTDGDDDAGRGGEGEYGPQGGAETGAGRAGAAAGGRGAAAGSGGNTAGASGRGGSDGHGTAGAGSAGSSGAGSSGAGSSGAGGGTAGSSSAPPSVLFSEYVEGSSRYKALELRALEPSMLDGCRIATYSNGGTTAKSVALSGALGAGQTFVVCSADLAELLGAVCTTTASLSFNGNDALALECGELTLDVLGQVGVDPGEAWASGDTSTANQTLRRRCSVTHGDAVGTDAFELGLEWAAFPTDDFSGLGVADCG